MEQNELAQRVEHLSGRISAVERDLAVIKTNYATKADVLEAKISIIMWVVSAVFLAQILPLLLRTFAG